MNDKRQPRQQMWDVHVKTTEHLAERFRYLSRHEVRDRLMEPIHFSYEDAHSMRAVLAHLTGLPKRGGSDPDTPVGRPRTSYESTREVSKRWRCLSTAEKRRFDLLALELHLSTSDLARRILTDVPLWTPEPHISRDRKIVCVQACLTIYEHQQGRVGLPAA